MKSYLEIAQEMKERRKNVDKMEKLGWYYRHQAKKEIKPELSGEEGEEIMNKMEQA